MLKERLAEDLKAAMKNADQKTVGVLRFLIAAINNKEIEKRGKGGDSVLTDEEVAQVLMSEAKKRKDSIAAFEEGGRIDLAGKEREELEIIQRYLPEQLSAEETEKVVEKILAETGVKDFGQAMKAVMRELKGKADGKTVSEIIKKKL